MYIYIYICVYMCIYTYIYIYTYILKRHTCIQPTAFGAVSCGARHRGGWTIPEGGAAPRGAIPEVGLYTILVLPILYGVLHSNGRSEGESYTV